MGIKKLLLVLIAQSFLIANISAQQTASPCPCCSEEYHQFDFWVGDWIVYSQGKPVGWNKIHKIENGCILRENWKSYDSSFSGTSYNFYDRADKKWKQVWIDDQGMVLELAGEYKDNKMILVGKEKMDVNGKRIINKITWTNKADGTVTQLWEASEDGGISFSVVFDALYRKKL